MSNKLLNCKVCGREIASSAKSCPNCGAKNKKPFHKRPIVIVCAFLVIISTIGQSDKEDNNYNKVNDVNSNQNTISSDVSQKNESGYNNIEIIKENNTTKEDDVPTEYKSALKKAQSYSDMMHMSKKGLYHQLTSEYGEQFSEESAQYAIDNVDADWKYNALKKAESYQEMMSMSPKAIYDQLTSEYGEKFTAEEAQYAIDNLK